MLKISQRQCLRLFASKAKKHENPQDITQQDFNLVPFESKMAAHVSHLKKEMDQFRTGRANPQILDSVKVTMDGKKTSLSQIAMINVKDAKTLLVIVSDEAFLKPAETAIKTANLNLNPQKIESTVLRVPVPPVSEDNREKIIRSFNQIAEKSRISIRKTRADARNHLTKMKYSSADLVRKLEKEIQACTDKFIKEVDTVIEMKQKDLNK